MFSVNRLAAGLALLTALVAGCSTAAATRPEPAQHSHARSTPPATAQPAAAPSSRAHHKHKAAHTAHASTPNPPAPTMAPPNPIPQHNGGDHDGDNNGGPSDGDGNI
jgi:hypothetical protein